MQGGRRREKGVRPEGPTSLLFRALLNVKIKESYQCCCHFLLAIIQVLTMYCYSDKYYLPLSLRALILHVGPTFYTTLTHRRGAGYPGSQLTGL